LWVTPNGPRDGDLENDYSEGGAEVLTNQAVSIVTRFAWPSTGGAQEVVRTLANGLSKNVGVEVFAQHIDDGQINFRGRLDRGSSWKPFKDPISGVKTSKVQIGKGDYCRLAPVLFSPHRLASRSSLYARYDRWLSRRVEQVIGASLSSQLKGASVIHRFGGNHMAAATVTAARNLDCPLVITPFAHPGDWDDDSISASAYRRADLVIATSRTDASLYEALGVHAESVRICPPPTDYPTRGGGRALREKYQLEGPVVCFFGVRRPSKGVHELVVAWREVHRAFPDACLAFVGPGDPLPADRDPRILDIGVVSAAERDAWLDATDLVCLPSSSESFGLVISEAWSVSAPVVTSDLAVLAERINESGGGIATPKTPGCLADAIKSLLDDGALRKAMGEAGHRHWLATSTPDKFLKFHIDAYRELLDGS
jgi:glycosyltransferase involved in cell wall biosynthesis